MSDTMLGWHFTSSNRLANNDAREIIINQRITNPVDEYGVGGAIVPCKRGLHFSTNAIDALGYAPGPILWRVEASGTIVPHNDPVDKYAASERTAIAGGRDVSGMLWAFARQCALDVLHLWKAPDAVRQYLTTGDLSLRAAARSAARAAAWSAARAAGEAVARAAGEDAARSAAWSAALSAARSAARAAARAAGEAAARAAARSAGEAAARAAARSAAWAAARDAQRNRLEAMCIAEVSQDA